MDNNDKFNELVRSLLMEEKEKIAAKNIEEKRVYEGLLYDYLNEDDSRVLPANFQLLKNDIKILILSECLSSGINIEDSKIYRAEIKKFDIDNIDKIDRIDRKFM